MNKIVYVLALFLICFFAYAAQKVELFVKPNPVRIGEPAQLVIRSNDGSRNMPLYKRMPHVKGITWHNGISQSSQTQIINGSYSSVFEASVYFTVDKPGNYTIPAMKLTHSKENTPSLTFTAVEAKYRTPVTRRRSSSIRNRVSNPADDEKNSVTLDQALFTEIEIPGKRPFYYLGEEIPLTVSVYSMRGTKAQISWPTVSFGAKDTAVLSDYRSTNRENSNFSGYNQTHEVRNGHDYAVYRFHTACRPIAAGKLEISAQEKSILLIPDESRRSRSDDFFDDFFGSSMFSRERQVPRNMTTEPRIVEIRNLPPLPDGTFFTGLVGQWNSQITLTPPPYRVGEPITLTLRFTGSRPADTLRTRPLNLNGFRIYPPEIQKTNSGAEIRYVLIPMETSDGQKENLLFGPYSYFNPATGRYVTGSFRRKLVIEKGTGMISGVNAGPYVVDTPQGIPNSVSNNTPDARRAEEVLYLKKDTGRMVSLPLVRNILLPGILSLCAGILFFVIALIIRIVKSSHGNDPVYQRHSAAHKRKSALLKHLAQTAPEEIAGNCSGEIADYIADALGLPPGSDLNECADAVEKKNPALANELRKLAQSAWMPSMNSKFDSAFRSRLIKLLGKVILFAMLLLPAMNLAGASVLKLPEIRSDGEAMNAYDSGKFDSAGKYYAGKNHTGSASAAAYYNMGNCLYKTGKLPQALIAYERAVRLDPRDPDILENLNLVCRKLQLPERYMIHTPSDVPPYLRDMLRPDEWGLLIFIGAALLFVAGGLMLLRANRIAVRSLWIIGIAMILASAAALISQKHSSYNGDHAIVMVKTLPVYSLPSEQIGKIEMHLRAGEEVTIAERRLDWLRIRSGSAEGWVPDKSVTPLWQEK